MLFLKQEIGKTILIKKKVFSHQVLISDDSLFLVTEFLVSLSQAILAWFSSFYKNLSSFVKRKVFLREKTFFGSLRIENTKNSPLHFQDSFKDKVHSQSKKLVIPSNPKQQSYNSEFFFLKNSSSEKYERSRKSYLFQVIIFIKNYIN